MHAKEVVEQFHAPTLEQARYEVAHIVACHDLLIRLDIHCARELSKRVAETAGMERPARWARNTCRLRNSTPRAPRSWNANERGSQGRRKRDSGNEREAT